MLLISDYRSLLGTSKSTSFCGDNEMTWVAYGKDNCLKISRLISKQTKNTHKKGCNIMGRGREREGVRKSGGGGNNSALTLMVKLTMFIIRCRHVSGKKLPLAAGNTLINCSKGLNWMKKQQNMTSVLNIILSYCICFLFTKTWQRWRFACNFSQLRSFYFFENQFFKQYIKLLYHFITYRRGNCYTDIKLLLILKSRS